MADNKKAPVKKEPVKKQVKITVFRRGMMHKIDKKNLQNFLDAGWKLK